MGTRGEAGGRRGEAGGRGETAPLRRRAGPGWAGLSRALHCSATTATPTALERTLTGVRRRSMNQSMAITALDASSGSPIA